LFEKFAGYFAGELAIATINLSNFPVAKLFRLIADKFAAKWESPHFAKMLSSQHLLLEYCNFLLTRGG